MFYKIEYLQMNTGILRPCFPGFQYRRKEIFDDVVSDRGDRNFDLLDSSDIFMRSISFICLIADFPLLVATSPSFIKGFDTP